MEEETSAAGSMGSADTHAFARLLQTLLAIDYTGREPLDATTVCETILLTGVIPRLVFGPYHLDIKQTIWAESPCGNPTCVCVCVCENSQLSYILRIKFV